MSQATISVIDMVINGGLLVIGLFFIKRLINEVDAIKEDFGDFRKVVNTRREKNDDKFDSIKDKIDEKTEETCSRIEKGDTRLSKQIDVVDGKVEGIKTENIKQNQNIAGHQKALEKFVDVTKNHDGRISQNESELKTIGKDLYIFKTKKGKA